MGPNRLLVEVFNMKRASGCGQALQNSRSGLKRKRESSVQMLVVRVHGHD